nr:nucleolar protein 11-like [Ciona intestinalis]|eukprot:XP_002123831.2 nucleolar protein 11-like [Ciona intestinalis]
MTLFEKKQLLLKSDQNLVGIRPGRNAEDVIFTYSNGITVYDTEHKKLKNSWSIGKGKYFTSPCVYNRKNAEYVVVQQENIIRIFSEQSFNDGQTFTVNIPIKEVQPDTNQIDSFVVFINTTILPLEVVLQNPDQIAKEGNFEGKILFSKILTNLTYVICVQKNNNKCNLRIVNGEQEWQISFQYKNLELSAACVDHVSSDIVKIFSVWSDGCLCETIISLPVNENYKTEFKKVYQFNTSCSGNITLVNLSSTCIAGLFPHESNQCEILAVDVKFGMCHSVMSNLSSYAQMYVSRSNLYMDDQQSVSIVPFSSQPITLSSVLGKHRASTSKQVVNMNSNNCPNQTNEQQLYETLLQVENEKQAIKQWEKSWRAKSHLEQQKLTSSNSMKELFIHLTDDKQPWKPLLLKNILKTTQISSNICPNLINVVLEHNEWSLLFVCVKHLHDITEVEIVTCLSVLLRNEIDMESLQEEILNEILNLPYTEDVMRDNLRRLTFTKVVNLLKMLERRLKELSLPITNLITFNQVASWIGLLLDTHSTEIITTPEIWYLLTELQATILMQAELFSELKKINAIFTQYRQSSFPIKNPNNFEYCIQRMVL